MPIIDYLSMATDPTTGNMLEYLYGRLGEEKAKKQKMEGFGIPSFQLPDIDLDIQGPKVEGPELPSVKSPELKMPESPSVRMPKIGLDNVGFDLSDITTGKVGLGLPDAPGVDIGLPKIDLGELGQGVMEGIGLEGVSLPSIDLSKVGIDKLAEVPLPSTGGVGYDPKTGRITYNPTPEQAITTAKDVANIAGQKGAGSALGKLGEIAGGVGSVVGSAQLAKAALEWLTGRPMTWGWERGGEATLNGVPISQVKAQREAESQTRLSPLAEQMFNKNYDDLTDLEHKKLLKEDWKIRRREAGLSDVPQYGPNKGK